MQKTQIIANKCIVYWHFSHVVTCALCSQNAHIVTYTLHKHTEYKTNIRITQKLRNHKTY